MMFIVQPAILPQHVWPGSTNRKTYRPNRHSSFLHQPRWNAMGFVIVKSPQIQWPIYFYSTFSLWHWREIEIWSHFGLPQGCIWGSPGVIREIVNMLWAYGVRKIYGIKGGYKGVMEPETWPPGCWLFWLMGDEDGKVGMIWTFF